MRRRLATLTAVAVLALAVGAPPAMAGSYGNHGGDHWVVVNRTTTDLTTYPTDVMAWLLDCSTPHRASTYTLITGFVDQVEMYRGRLDATGVALTPGRGVETWTLRDVRVRSDQTGRVYRAFGASAINFTWNKGATYSVGPFTSGLFVQGVSVLGTRDGRSFVQVGVTWPMTMVSDHGTCANLQVGMS